MLGIKISRAGAEEVRRYLKERRLLGKDYSILRKNSFIYFPMLRRPTQEEGIKLEGSGAVLTYAKFRKGRHEGSVARDSEGRRMGYDIMGNIAIIDPETGSIRKLAKGIMAMHKNVETVLRKGGAVKGRYRIRKYVCVAGRRNYIAKYRENNCVFTFDLSRVFFSPRLAYERKRISELARDGERVVVMFAGVGPFAIELAKLRKGAKVVAIELNRAAYAYMLENIKANNVKNVTAECGDVKAVASKYRGFADRIVMPLPKSSGSFIDSALLMAGRSCTIHYYTFCRRGEAWASVESLRAMVRSNGGHFRHIMTREVRPYSPGSIEIAIDFMVRQA